MHSNFHRHIKLFGKMRFLYRSLLTNIFLFASQGKFFTRSCEDRREYSYTAYIPERRSGKDRRKSKNEKSAFWFSIYPHYKKKNSLKNHLSQQLLRIWKTKFLKAYLPKSNQKTSWIFSITFSSRPLSCDKLSFHKIYTTIRNKLHTNCIFFLTFVVKIL